MIGATFFFTVVISFIGCVGLIVLDHDFEGINDEELE